VIPGSAELAVIGDWTAPGAEYAPGFPSNATGDWSQLRIVSCPAGYEIVNAGWRQLGRQDLAVREVANYPDPNVPTQWRLIFAGPDGVNLNTISPKLGIQVFAVCVAQPQP
jgi:hypothetical protein